jgi:hypothetical protein
LLMSFFMTMTALLPSDVSLSQGGPVSPVRLPCAAAATGPCAGDA